MISSVKTSDSASVRPKVRAKHSKKPIGEPLERRTIKFEDRDCIERCYPALHIKFSHTMIFTKYGRLPLKAIADSKLKRNHIEDNDAINDWFANVTAFEEMIKTLLRLKHNQFWSTLVHEKSLQICLESYLRFAPRAHDSHNFLLTDQMKTHIKRVYILVFKLYFRICSSVESKMNFISETTFGNLIYDNNLLEVTKIIDLCVIYSNSDFRNLLSPMLSHVIQCQPRYKEDLLKVCTSFSGALFSILQRIGSDDNQFERISKLSYIQWSELQSIVYQMTDISVSLEAFLQLIPDATQISSDSIDKTIVEFYNRVFPALQNELNQRLTSIQNNDLIVDQIRRQIMISRSHLILTFRHIIENCFLNKLFDKSSKVESKINLIDQMIETLTLASFEKGFISDYCLKYPIEIDFEELSKQTETTQFDGFDKTRIEYLRNVIKSSVSTEVKPQNQITLKENEEKVNGFIDSQYKNDIEMESKIQYIHEIMSELGPGFIEKCLIYFDCDTEKVLNAILENNLPPHLESMDRCLKNCETKDITHYKGEPKELIVCNGGDIPNNQLHEVIESRNNVFNSDEFDIFRNKNIDLSRIHSGKIEKSIPQIDDRFKQKIMNLHENALRDEENERINILSIYNDEFDDTYEDDTTIDLPDDKLKDELEDKSSLKDNNFHYNKERDGYNHKHRNRKNKNFR